jgi:serine/threonine-protein kinase
LLAEARLLYEVRHWALPTVKDVVAVDNREIFMVMSYIEGSELMQHVQENGPMDPETSCWIAQRVLAALHYLHFIGVVHRDVKPANIIVDWETHNAVLVDFGLAKTRPTRKSEATGYTPFFGAPEQLAAKPAIPQSDIYGLGMTMIYMLGGDLYSKSLPVGVPRELKEMVLSLVRVDPLRRPECCNSLNRELGLLRQRVFGRAHTR